MSLWLMHALSSQSSVDGASFLEVAHDERAFHLSAAASCHECDRKASTDPSVTGFVFWLRPVSPDVAKSASPSEAYGSPRKESAPCLSAAAGSRPPTSAATAAAERASPLSAIPPRRPWKRRRAAGRMPSAMKRPVSAVTKYSAPVPEPPVAASISGARSASAPFQQKRRKAAKLKRRHESQLRASASRGSFPRHGAHSAHAQQIWSDGACTMITAMQKRKRAPKMAAPGMNGWHSSPRSVAAGEPGAHWKEATPPRALNPKKQYLSGRARGSSDVA